jgi:predicted molibdopterin-dependent oxidoreductase YjgC
MTKTVRILLNGEPTETPAGSTVAAALFNAGSSGLRRSVSGQPRGPICAMGICFECRVTIDGRPHQRACMEVCREGMEVQTDD